MVAQPVQSHGGHPLLNPHTRNHPYQRCLAHRLECSHSWPHGAGPVDLQRSKDAYQHSRTMSGPARLSCFFPLSTPNMYNFFQTTTAVTYINKYGGARLLILCRETIWLCNWCLQHNVTLHAIHIPGIDNTLADMLSHSFHFNHEWEVHDPTLHSIVRQWGTPG